VAGAVHVHTRASDDAWGDLSDTLRVAREEGLSFLVLGDHNGADALGGARAVVVDRVLVVNGTEWSTDQGHLLDLSFLPAAQRLRDAREAVADCRARGGPCVAGHPVSQRTPWVGALHDLDGMEVHSLMHALGDRTKSPVTGLLPALPLLLAWPQGLVWDVGAGDAAALAALEKGPLSQGVAAFCGSDLHGHIPLRENLLGFLTLVGLPEKPPDDPVAAGHAVRRALAGSPCVNALAGWVDGLALVVEGDSVVVRAQVQGTAGPAEVVLRRGGQEVGRAGLVPGQSGEVRAPREGGAWRAEVEVDAPGLVGRMRRTAAVRLLWVDGAP
jgi:hypothetical protein